MYTLVCPTISADMLCNKNAIQQMKMQYIYSSITKTVIAEDILYTIYVHKRFTFIHKEDKIRKLRKKIDSNSKIPIT